MFDSPMQSTTPWALLGVAVRLLQDVGAHRKVTAEALKHSGTTAETYKRMWWVLYSMDREFSAGHGRPVAIQDEDFDTEDPCPIDDEFLALADEQGRPAKQPDGQPSKFEGFIATLRLDQVSCTLGSFHYCSLTLAPLPDHRTYSSNYLRHWQGKGHPRLCRSSLGPVHCC